MSPAARYFSTRNIKIVNRKQQYHDDAYDFSGSSHILIEDGFAMTMDDTWALYRARIPDGRSPGHRGFRRERICQLLLYLLAGPRIWRRPGRQAPAPGGRAFRRQPQQVRHLDSADARVFYGAGVFRGRQFSRNAPLDDFQFVNCTFENDGGQVYIDGGDYPLTNFVFENCTFYKTTKPSLIMGKNVAPVLFKNVKVNGAVIQNAGSTQGIWF